MATGRTKDRWCRVYHDGYDISGNVRSVGPMGIVYDEANLTAVSDPVSGYLANTPQCNVDAINGIYDNTATTGLHIVAQSAGIRRTLLVAIGQLAEPAAGDVCFGGQFTQGEYSLADDGGAVVANLPYQGWAADATFSMFTRPFGFLLHAKGAETAVNTAVGQDDNGAATAAGSWMCYHVLAGDAGNAIIRVQDAATNSNGSFTDVTGLTSGTIAASAGVHGIVAATTLTLRRYTRWQVTFSTAATITFVLSINRG